VFRCSPSFLFSPSERSQHAPSSFCSAGRRTPSLFFVGLIKDSGGLFLFPLDNEMVPFSFPNVLRPSLISFLPLRADLLKVMRSLTCKEKERRAKRPSSPLFFFPRELGKKSRALPPPIIGKIKPGKYFLPFLSPPYRCVAAQPPFETQQIATVYFSSFFCAEIWCGRSGWLVEEAATSPFPPPARLTRASFSPDCRVSNARTAAFPPLPPPPIAAPSPLFPELGPWTRECCGAPSFGRKHPMSLFVCSSAASLPRAGS